MQYRTALSINISHDYWADKPAPLQIVAADPYLLRHTGMALRGGGPGAVLALLEDAQGLPRRVAFDILITDTQLIGLTRGWRADSVPVFAPKFSEPAEGDETRVQIALTDKAQSNLPRAPGDRRLCRIDLAFDPTRFPIVCSIACETVQALWAYHIVGKVGPAPIRIVADADTVDFDDLGEEVLPNGRTARVLRSTAPLPLLHRNGLRLALQQDQPPPYDPETLIPVLPVGGANLRPAPGGPPADILQSDIYISL